MRADKYILFAILAAIFYALNAPLSKLLLYEISPKMLASLLYLGAGAGLFIIGLFHNQSKIMRSEKKLSKIDLSYIIGMVLLDTAAPIFLTVGLSSSTAASVSLLGNFETVATAVIALFIFKEAISKRLWAAIALVTLASIMLSLDDIKSLSFSAGSLFVLLACVCWGFENNCTKKLSAKNPLQIVVIKGIFSGLGAFIVAKLCNEHLPDILLILAAMLLGFVAFGLSIYFYIYAQRGLGAAKTCAIYAISPFMAAALSLIIWGQIPSISFIAAVDLMSVGAYLAATSARERTIIYDKKRYKL